MLVVRATIYWRYRDRYQPQFARQYGLFLVVGSAVTGLIWGIGGAVMLPTENLEYQLFILFVLMGMGIGSTSSLSIYLPAFFAFFPVLIIPISSRLISMDGQIQLTLGVLGIIYVVAISSFNIKINRSLKETIRLRFENQDLVNQLREQKKEADNANKAKSKFLAAASHDLRQPLYALTLFTSTLDEVIRYPEVRRVVQQIMTSVASMKNLFNALLDISQLDAGVIELEKSNFLLQPLFHKLANDFNPQAAAKGLSILWPSSHVAIHSDRDLFEQILRNLLANAVRYTDQGSISVSCKGENDEWVISITDTGLGIAEENQKGIFEEFNQLGNRERDRQKGLGLGLAIVKRSAQLLEHPIALLSQPGQGSTFSITVQGVEIDDCHIDPDRRLTPELNCTIETLLIIIDDEASVREGTKALFQSWGCNVITAPDTDDALAKIRQQQLIPDGIIADYRLRGDETGVNSIQAIHQQYGNKIPAMIVTGDIAVERLQDVASSGFQMLHKPVAALKLRTFLRNMQHSKTS